MTENERELLLLLANRVARLMRNGVDRTNIDRLATRVRGDNMAQQYEQGQREEFPGANALKYELEQHLDMRYEVKGMKIGVGHDGDIYLTDCLLRPRDEF